MNKQHLHQQGGYTIYLLTKMLFFTSIALSLIGCIGVSPNYNSPNHNSTTQKYFDSAIFDSTLSENMDRGSSKIEITISTPFSRNNIPDRLDAWLTFIENSSGKIIEEPAEGERDIIMLILPGCKPYKKIQIQKVAMYFPAQNYNATLLIKKDESGEAMISKIVFTHR